MGNNSSVSVPKTRNELQSFIKHLLRDTHALEKMLFDEVFETDIIRIGAEQELNLIDSHYKPATINMKVLEKLDPKHFTTELARFNMEVNLEPLEFTGKCLSEMEKSIIKHLDEVRKVAKGFDADIILTGILPSIRKFDLTQQNRTPFERYKALLDAVIKMKGGSNLELKIRGIDELIMSHDSPMLEAANTGFQVHLQVRPDDFTSKYNIAQAIAGPALAVATNSPILFGKRLWHETRIALFQQSVDTRSTGDHLRNRSPRVMFGHDWVKKSILEIYKEDILRFRVLLSTNQTEDALKVLESGKVPHLHALLMHNSTVYRWNRPCYGQDGKIAHLRIENRVLPAGPTVIDEMANAALWLGLLNGMEDVYPDVTKTMEFEDAKSNFIAACRMGLDNKFTWMKGKRMTAADLLQKELIPIAKDGLKKAKIAPKDIKRYMDVLNQRVDTAQTGSRWALKSYSKLTKSNTRETAIASIVACTVKNQRQEIPVAKWELATLGELGSWELASLIVEEFMTTDLFTVHYDDILELVAMIMDSGKLRYVPVEDDEGNLVGLITSRTLLRHYYKNDLKASKKAVPIEDIMIKDPITISPDETIATAMDLMTENEIGCLPVVKNQKLIGIIVEQDFLKISRRLMKKFMVKK